MVLKAKTGKHTPVRKRDLSPSVISGNTTEINDFASCIDDQSIPIQNVQSIKKALEEPAIAYHNDDTMHSFDGDVFFDISVKKTNNVQYKLDESQEKLLDNAKNFKPIQYFDDFRLEEAYRDGGFSFDDQE